MAMTKDQQVQYKTELLKVGFDEAAANRIVAEAVERLKDELSLSTPTGGVATQPKTPTPEQTKEQRAVHVIATKQRRLTLRRGWPRPKPIYTEPGENALSAMQRMLIADLRALEFTQDDIDFIIGAEK